MIWAVLGSVQCPARSSSGRAEATRDKRWEVGPYLRTGGHKPLHFGPREPSQSARPKISTLARSSAEPFRTTAASAPSTSGEHYHAIGGNHHRSRRRKAVSPTSVCINAGAV